MEDRHTISDPRPLVLEKIGSDDDLPSWEVDIIRDDTVIVDTVVLNNENLPPRTNKKGKVIWRLPDSTDKLVRSHHWHKTDFAILVAHNSKRKTSG